jgi:dihydrofolate reductase
MRRLIVQEFVTLDGLAAGPNGETDFIPAAVVGDARFADSQMRFIDSIDTMALGRVNYEMFASYWPTATGDDKPFADKLNALDKLVFSRTIDRAPWGSFEDATLTRNDPRDEIPRLKAREGKDIVVWGSLTLVQSLAEARLVDEYQLWVLPPLVLGGGRPLFAEGVGSIRMDLLEAKSTDQGATLLRYEPR